MGNCFSSDRRSVPRVEEPPIGGGVGGQFLPTQPPVPSLTPSQNHIDQPFPRNFFICFSNIGLFFKRVNLYLQLVELSLCRHFLLPQTSKIL